MTIYYIGPRSPFKDLTVATLPKVCRPSFRLPPASLTLTPVAGLPHARREQVQYLRHVQCHREDLPRRSAREESVSLHKGLAHLPGVFVRTDPSWRRMEYEGGRQGLRQSQTKEEGSTRK